MYHDLTVRHQLDGPYPPPMLIRNNIHPMDAIVDANLLYICMCTSKKKLERKTKTKKSTQFTVVVTENLYTIRTEEWDTIGYWFIREMTIFTNPTPTTG
jgi:hypothetical protein